MPQRELSMEHAGEKAGDADASREEYVHVRAKRGQATNSHSLAERVIDLSNINGRSFCVQIFLLTQLHHLNAVSKGEDKRKDEASAGPRPRMQQGSNEINNSLSL